MADPRLYVAEELRAGAGIALDEGQARHVGGVLRLDVGDTLRVFNAVDGEWRARVAEKSKRGMRVAVETHLRAAQASPDITLFFAPLKRQATDWVVEKATELGVRQMRPVITQRTVAETVRLDRLRMIARDAAQQCERFDLPQFSEPTPLPNAFERSGVGAVIYADEAGDDDTAAWGGDAGRAPPILDVLRALKVFGGLGVLIGPEGGFTADERRMLRNLSFVKPVSLGPRILRAETAVVAALTVAQAAWGDWRA